MKVRNYLYLDDPKLSWKAKGILAYFLLAEKRGENVNQQDLFGLSTDGESSVRSGIQELMKAGYLTRKRIFVDGNKMVGIEYTPYPKGNY